MAVCRHLGQALCCPLWTCPWVCMRPRWDDGARFHLCFPSILRTDLGTELCLVARPARAPHVWRGRCRLSGLPGGLGGQGPYVASGPSELWNPHHSTSHADGSAGRPAGPHLLDRLLHQWPQPTLSHLSSGRAACVWQRHLCAVFPGDASVTPVFLMEESGVLCNFPVSACPRLGRNLDAAFRPGCVTWESRPSVSSGPPTRGRRGSPCPHCGLVATLGLAFMSFSCDS